MVSLFVHFYRLDQLLSPMFKIHLCKRQILRLTAYSPFLLSESPLPPPSGSHLAEAHFECFDPSRKSLVRRYPNSESRNHLQFTAPPLAHASAVLSSLSPPPRTPRASQTPIDRGTARIRSYFAHRLHAYPCRYSLSSRFLCR